MDELIDLRNSAYGQRDYYKEYAGCWNCDVHGHTWEECDGRNGMEELDREIEHAGWREGR
jgi:hypothetical protein